MAGLFAKNYRSAHEPNPEELIYTILQESKGQMTQEKVIDFIRSRDQKLFLEFEANCLLYYCIDPLVDIFSDTKFILTIRDCYSWLNSMLNQHYIALSGGFPPHWIAMLDYMFPVKKESYNYKYESWLHGTGLAPIESYFSYWASHNRKIISTIPASQLLIIRTNEISSDIKRIANFVGIDSQSLDSTQTHLFRRKNKPLNVLSEIDPDFLEEKARFYCGDIMQQVFGGMPDIKKVFWEKD